MNQHMDTEKNAMLVPAFLGAGGVLVLALVLFLFVHENNLKNRINLDTYVSSEPLSALFKCPDGTRFIAEFPSTGELYIVTDGKPKQTFSSFFGSKNDFRDNFYQYNFMSEEVHVISLQSKKLLRCVEQTSPDRWPVNFGDTGTGGGHQINMDLIDTTKANLVGKWQSTDGRKYEFTKGGTIVNTTDSSNTIYYGWAVLVDGVFVKVNFTLEPGTPYLQIYDQSTMITKPLTRSYKISKVTPEELELQGIGGEANMSFRKIQ